jgi:DNA-binding CsgD family transcriptional regulator/MFS family permease
MLENNDSENHRPTLRDLASGLSASLVFGTGLYLIWAISLIAVPMFWRTQLGFTLREQAADDAFLFQALFFPTFIIAALLMGLAGERIGYYVRLRRTHLFAVLVSAAGLCVLLLGFSMELPAILLVGSGLVSGFGLALFTLEWGASFCCRDLPAIILNGVVAVLAAAILAAALFALLDSWPFFGAMILSLVPLPISAFLTISLCGIQGLLKPQATYINEDGKRRTSPELFDLPILDDLPISKKLFTVMLGGSTLLFGLALGVLLAGGFFHQPRGSVIDNLITLTFASLLISALLLWFLLHPDLGYYFQQLLVVIVALMAFLWVLASALPLDVFSWIGVSFSCAFAFVAVWSSLADVSVQYRVSTILVFGIGFAFVVLGVLLGVSVDLAASNAGIWSTGLTAVFALAALCTGVFFFPKKHDIKAMSSLELNKLSEGLAVQSADVREKGHFKLACEFVSNTYLLTKRESEILVLLGKGRNVPYIMKHFNLSEGTVNTHKWRMYQKLDVTSQQGLIDLIEDHEQYI